jgi:hypothetical protein
MKGHPFTQSWKNLFLKAKGENSFIKLTNSLDCLPPRPGELENLE